MYDMTSAWHTGGIPLRFATRCNFPGVRFEGYLGSTQPFSEVGRVHFSPPAGADLVDDLLLARSLVEVDYLINLPIARASNNLFFGRDPLVAEGVMAGLLASETALPPETGGYLRLAAAVGAGVCERADPWQNTYRQIDCVRVELDL